MYLKKRASRVKSALPLISLAALAACGVPAARAAQYLVTVRSTFMEDQSASETFDGVNYGTLPFFPLDNSRLAGGTMLEHFIISDVTTETSGSSAFYTFEPSSEWTYDLFDPLGQLVHHAAESSDGGAGVENNYGNAPYSVDQVFLTANFASITNLTTHPADFAPFFNVADLNCFGYVSPGVDYLSDLSLPLDASVYLSFPSGQVITDAVVALGSGDVVNFADPYAYTTSYLVYSVDSLSITAIPEPSALWGAVPGFLALVRRRR